MPLAALLSGLTTPGFSPPPPARDPSNEILGRLSVQPRLAFAIQLGPLGLRLAASATRWRAESLHYAELTGVQDAGGNVLSLSDLIVTFSSARLDNNAALGPVAYSGSEIAPGHFAASLSAASAPYGVPAQLSAFVVWSPSFIGGSIWTLDCYPEPPARLLFQPLTTNRLFIADVTDLGVAQDSTNTAFTADLYRPDGTTLSTNRILRPVSGGWFADLDFRLTDPAQLDSMAVRAWDTTRTTLRGTQRVRLRPGG